MLWMGPSGGGLLRDRPYRVPRLKGRISRNGHLQGGLGEHCKDT